jgi:RNA-directed DNA polymerase
MSLVPPPTVRKLQEALHSKAKKASDYRFYALYDKVYRSDVLYHAYVCCRANDGTAGVDGQRFEDIEKAGLGPWLDALACELRQKTYRPQAVRRVWIPKADGKQRPLGIPTVRDRVVQMAALLVLEPIFEADMQPEQYGYRAGRSALDAVSHVKALIRSGHTQVVDADLSGYFDSIPHAELLRSLARRISDGPMLALLARWLEMPVEETDDQGNRQRTSRNKDQGRGTPQGAPLSPLLANLYMRRFILGWKRQGHDRRFQATIVNYADDFVICCRRDADEAMAVMRDMMARLKLTVNETKTRLCRVPDETFNFLGYSIGQCRSPRTGGTYLSVWPADKKVRAFCTSLSDMTRRCWTWLSVQEMVQQLNQRIAGWANYFCLGTVSDAYSKVMDHTCMRLRQWLGRKTGTRVWAARCPDQYLHAKLGLIDLAKVRKAYRASGAKL